jgi:hypothetical protein
MSAGWFALVLAPPAAFLALIYALYPSRPSIAPLRLAVVRAAVATAAFAVLAVEVLGAMGWLTPPGLAAAWGVALAVSGALAAARRRHPQWTPGSDRIRRFWRTASRGERLMGVAIGTLLLVELVIALLAEPNNYDSQTYHLPKIERWAAQGSLEFWPTNVSRQVTIPPGAEYLMLHLRLFTGGDRLYDLLQWMAGVGCVLVVSRIAAQLGGSRRAQLIAAFLFATTPMVTLQATSTQTDLATAAWVTCVATIALDGLRARATVAAVLTLGAATGLTAVTKTSGLLGAGPMALLWAVAQLRLALSAPAGRPRVLLRTVGGLVAVLALATAITGPFLLRITQEFGNPLGPPWLRVAIGMQRHDPPSVLVNGLRIGHTALDTPLEPVGKVTAAGITGFARLIGVDPQDRATTFGVESFPPRRSWHPDEDRVSFPIAGALALIGGAAALCVPRRVAPEYAAPLRAYALAVSAAVLLYCATVKWQPWGNRLLLFALALGVPLAGLWLDALFRSRASASAAAGAGRRSVAVLVAVAVLATSALAGVLAVSYGFPRRLVGGGSLLTTDDWDTRFLRRPAWAGEFRWAAAAVRESGAQRIGVVQRPDDWEYPWWLLLREGPQGDREFVTLLSPLPRHRAERPARVDAIVCTSDRALCARFVPRGWRMEFRGYVGYAVPPG